MRTIKRKYRYRIKLVPDPLNSFLLKLGTPESFKSVIPWYISLMFQCISKDDYELRFFSIKSSELYFSEKLSRFSEQISPMI
jgi:hypothetical protein